MEDLYKEGRVKAIGLSNFFLDQVIDLISHNQILPVINQIEVNPFYQRSDDQVILNKRNIAVQSWSSFAEGKNNFFQNEILTFIGEKYNKSVAQVTLRWLIQRGIAVIPKSVNKDRIIENADIWDFELTNEDMNAISSLDTGKSLFFNHRDPETTEEITHLKFY